MKYEQRIIHKYKQYSDLTKENGFKPLKPESKNGIPILELENGIPIERYSVPREVKGVKAHKHAKQETKHDLNIPNEERVAIQLNIPQFISKNGEIIAEEIDCFTGKYSNALVMRMIEDYLLEDMTPEEFEDTYYLHGKLQKDLLETMQRVAKEEGKWVSRQTNDKQIAIMRLSCSRHILTFLIGCETQKIFEILFDATYEHIVETIKEKASFVECIYANFSVQLRYLINRMLPSVDFKVDFLQIPLFIEDLISKVSTKDCRKELRKCKRKFEKICTDCRTYNNSANERNKLILKLREIATEYSEIHVGFLIENFITEYDKTEQVFNEKHDGFSGLYLPYKHIKNILYLLLDKRFSIGRIYFHICCGYERLNNKCTPEDAEKIKNLEIGETQSSGIAIRTSRLDTLMYKMIWTDAKEMYTPCYTQIEDNANGKYIGKDGINIWYFIGFVLGDIGYEINPEVFFEYDITNLCAQDVYSDLELFKDNDVMIRINSPTLHTPTNSLDAVLERRDSSETWETVETWTQTANDENVLGFTERRTVEPNFFYRVRCNHHKGAKTFTTCSEEVWVGMNREEYQILKESGFFDDK